MFTRELLLYYLLLNWILKFKGNNCSDLHDTSSPSTLISFVLISKAAVAVEDMPSTPLYTEDKSTLQSNPPLAGDIFQAWLSQSIVLKASLLLAVKGESISFFPPNLPSSPPDVIWPVHSFPHGCYRIRKQKVNHAGFLSERAQLHLWPFQQFPLSYITVWAITFIHDMINWKGKKYFYRIKTMCQCILKI